MKKQPQHAFASVLLAHWQLLKRRATLLEKSPSAAEDLVHDTLERALRYSETFTPGSNVAAWLLRIMSNLWVDGHRHRSYEMLWRNQDFPDPPAPEPRIPSGWEMMSLEDVEAVIPQLAPPLRTVIDLYLEGTCSYRQMSARLGISTQTVGTRLHRARNKIRSLLEPKAGLLQRACSPIDA